MTTTAAEPAYWSSIQKIAFRFFTLFFVLYIFFNPNGVIPFTDGLFNFYIQPFHTFIPWLAKHVLHLGKAITIFTNGSGDTTYDYLIILFLTTVSSAGAIIWSITGRKTRNYNKLLYWLTVVIRYYVAITMVSYGCAKIIKLQFPSPSFGKLTEPVGNMSPMGLAWTYMGYSTGFNYFTGFAELIAGLLLFFRKTTALGAIIGLVVAGNIMAINYCFDVPVKLLSTFLVLMCLFLMIRDTTRLINFFFRNREALPSNLSPHRFKARWKNITLCVIKFILIAFTIWSNFANCVSLAKQYGDNGKKPPLYGLYKVESFAINNNILPPLTTDTTRWNKFWISYPGGFTIKLMNDSTKYYPAKTDTIKHQIVVNLPTDTVRVYTLNYSFEKPDIMILKGNWKQDSVLIRLHKMDPKNFPLLKRGFHWVNEFPYNK
ncbi:DoxX family protein [Mucilaginibacter sp. BJC16-A38]|uniref:DoxX family protein n=1 Tax=Mucilaginibacter phenanthrenivorans TaxID=1234842 RepID=UPI0021586748|nr:DoxX family protein [Mucilaginibacter phenanthrenivorans]MCR8558301.1 DoxX family protein [Mucilaginibacter phenanthrenivorans]